MKRLLIALLALCPIAVGQIPTAIGWSALGSSTVLVNGVNCPTATFQSANFLTATNGCAAGMFAYSGGVYDQTYHRQLLFGGGHEDYRGNELYGLNLAGNLGTERLTDPTIPGAPDTSCNEANPANLAMPNSRHTYGGLVYVPAIAETGGKPMLYVAGGKVACAAGFMSNAIWSLDLTSIPPGGISSPSWTKRFDGYTGNNVTSDSSATYFSTEVAAVFDDATHTILAASSNSNGYAPLWKYILPGAPANSGTMNRLIYGANLGSNLAIAPRRRLLMATSYSAANSFAFVDLTTLTPTGTTDAPAETTVAVHSSCSGAYATYNSDSIQPSIAYDPVWNIFVIYPAHGAVVYLFNPGDPFHTGTSTDKTVQAGAYGSIAPRTCLAVTPPGTAPPDGTAQGGSPGGNYSVFGRFTYAPEFDVFVYSPGSGQQAQILRLNRAASNTVMAYSTSGSAQTNRPVSIPRFFARQEISNYPQPVIAGTPATTWQSDVKNRWSDGSVKFAIVSAVVPTLATTGTAITFQNATSRDSGGAGSTPTGYLANDATSGFRAAAYDFDAQIRVDNGGGITHTISALAMLTAGNNFTYWLQGPVVTAAIIEDRAGRTFDVNVDGATGTPLHPIFEAWFYPQNHKVEVGYTLENDWASNTAANSSRDQTYSFTLCGGATNCAGTPTFSFTQASYKHIGFTRWHKTYWTSTAPGTIRLDFNSQYVTNSTATLNYNTTLNPDTALAARQTSWNGISAARKAINGDSVSGFIGDIAFAISGVGGQDWIAPQPIWEALYILTFDDTMRDEMLTNADLMGYWQTHFREADASAGSVGFFDAGGTVGTQGRIVSVNARPLAALSTPDFPTFNLRSSNNNCGGTFTTDEPTHGTVTVGNWTRGPDSSHEPDIASMSYLFTGKYYYMEEVQMQGAFNVAQFKGCTGTGSPFFHQGNWGIFPSYELRTMAWGLRQLSHAATFSPDGTPEQAYFIDKTQNNIAFLEGSQGVVEAGATASYPSKSTIYNFGRDTWGTGSSGIFASSGVTAGNHRSPLGTWFFGYTVGYESGDGAVNCDSANSGFQDSFLSLGLGFAKEAGFSADNLLKWLAVRPFNITLNSSVNHYLNSNGGGVAVAGYVNCFRSSATHDWIQTWTDWSTNYYSYTTCPSPPSGTPVGFTGSGCANDYVFANNNSAGKPLYGEYPEAALGALAVSTGITVGNWDNVTTYNGYRALLPNILNDELDNVKFAIAPRAGTAVTVPPAPTYRLTVGAIGNGTGTISSTDSFISCGLSCTHTYNSGDSIVLTEAPSSGSQFAGWSGACSGTGSCTVSMTADQSVTATFNLLPPPPGSGNWKRKGDGGHKGVVVIK